MSLRCIKIFLPLFLVAQGIVAQLPNLKNGCQNLPAPETGLNFNQPVGGNFPAASNIPYTNKLTNDNVQKAYALQSALPKLQMINGQIGEILNLVSTINNRQLTGSNTLAASSQNNINMQQTPNNGLPLNNLAPNNPYLPGNGIYQIGSNLLNNVPINNFISTASNLPDSNNFQYNVPVNRNVPVNLPVQSPAKINSLTLTGQPFNNGLPFNVFPANAAPSNANSIPTNNFINYNSLENNGLKLPRSLPVNEMPENSIPESNSVISNNVTPASWQNYINDVQTANFMANTIPQNNFINNGLPANTELLINQAIPTYVPANSPGIPSVDGFIPNNTPLNNIDFTNNKNLNYIQQNEQFQQFLPQTQSVPMIQNYQNTELPTANCLAASQPVGNNLNLPDFGNTLCLGELGKFPIFSGVPVIGYSETFSLINPDQLGQTPLTVF